jgi:hypothetical protein
MRIVDRRGEPVPEATITVDDTELIELLQSLADLAEGKKEHAHVLQPGGAQLVIERGGEADAEPLDRQMDWWVGPLILFATIFIVIGLINFIRWAVNLL